MKKAIIIIIFGFVLFVGAMFLGPNTASSLKNSILSISEMLILGCAAGIIVAHGLSLIEKAAAGE